MGIRDVMCSGHASSFVCENLNTMEQLSPRAYVLVDARSFLALPLSLALALAHIPR